jgi:hypothetical protein
MLLALNFTIPPSFPFDIPKPQIEIPKIISPMDIASDSSFSTLTTNFSPGQTIYVRVTNQNTNQPEIHVLNLHDSSYKILQSFDLAQNGNVYSAGFQAPNGDGTYSVEAKLVANGSANDFVKTIQIGSGSSGSNVSIHQQSDNGTSSPGPSLSSTPSPTDTPKTATQSPLVLGSAPGNIFVRLWMAVTSFWAHFWH